MDVNESKEVNPDFHLCAAFLLQIILESIKSTVSGGEGKGTEQVRLISSMGITNSKILCPFKGSGIIFLIQVTSFWTHQVAIARCRTGNSIFK